MTIIRAVMWETILRLSRDKVFFPAVVIGIFLMLMTTLASDWGIEDFFKILTDFSTISFHLTGVIVAIFWGVKSIGDQQQEGSIEVQLAAPINRTTWLIGKYLGLVATLTILAFLYMLGLQGLNLIFGYGQLHWHLLMNLTFVYVLWLVIGAASVFFASITSGPVALFSTLSLWVSGLLSQPLFHSLAANTPDSTRKFLEIIATFWNLHLYNLSDYVYPLPFPPPEELLFRLGVACLQICFFLGLASYLFQKKDIVP